MKQIFDFIPLVIFFFFYKLYGIYVGTGALIISTIMQVIATWILYNKVEKMQVVSAALLAVFGGLTLFFQNDDFIKWKVTIVYTMFAGGLIISQYLGKPLIKSILGKGISLPNSVWNNINLAWIALFSILAVVNLYVAYTHPLDVWINFKVFGLFAVTLSYTLATGMYIYKHLSKK
ncbi:septation protein A [Candidatus Enterovibrio escicola]|uniref:Inner membrane-spanning protein YciB n=1 Tax=Candidatus Enterovibrio escicola TaxID=1927127 RepID=A0A2A5T408_9GAMM|nr:septation protein A [Candidatus Enterovibrio escacola]PCS22897.1 Intracellular septation protein IspA [Candidatus Enterovibrio escacola]